MGDWIDKNIRIYKDIYKENIEKEIAISHCALSMVKILNGLSEMNHTEFYKYEKEMVWNAMELFSEQCIDQIYYVLPFECKNVESVREKKEIISDIENSISQMMEVCKNIFDATANAERKMFQSLSVDTNMYELSPKLCAFYSSILENVVTLFADNEKEYAFVLHPTLRSTIEAKLLLEKRKKAGKVVIIYISESVIEQFNLVPICLMHEAFHVITKRERHRKERAINFGMNMIDCIERFLFCGIIFSENKEEDISIKKRFMNCWFNDIRKLMQQWGLEPEESKRFYSKNIKQELINKIRKCLADISNNLEETVFTLSCRENEQKNYFSYKKDIERVKGFAKQIRDNLECTILANMVSKAASLFMFLYREIYADVACILTLELDAAHYVDAFINSIQFNFDEKSYKDTNRRVREYLVTKTVSDLLPENLNWKKYLLEIETQMELEQKKEEPFNESKKSQQRGRQKGDNRDKITNVMISKEILRRFQGYLTECARDFYFRQHEINGIEKFRASVKNVIMEKSDKLLIGILSGNATI